ncbi:MAG: hypothetical protein Q3M24_01565 [Candidatus Electrothrix aestuarii]|uniref:Uncharacterized protein n=1 Tax=Candidatus Electrothrix aestuarii TaxID=3062594 RepID=A0AAU8LWB2_9BACT|nr:hypothetical protein [Candidatus Electrothrix aestuarii]WPD22428.1 MAG: hypothetical protein SD837_19840 [Candidatus Electrothrix sp. GW3-3]
MNEYRQAHSVALYDAGVAITNSTKQVGEEDEGYPLATGMPPGSFRIPENDLAALKSEFRTKQVVMPMGRRQGGSLNFHKALSSYNEALGEDAQVKNLLIRVDGPQLLSLQIVEEHPRPEGKHTETKEITYCGFFAIEWATPEL